MKSSANSARTTSLPLESVDFVQERLRMAHAIMVVSGRIFATNERTIERDGQALLSIQHGGRLLHECLDHMDYMPRLSGGGTLCETDPWWSDLQESAGLTDNLDTAVWADGSTITFSPEVASSYVSAVEGSIMRARKGLAEVAHG